MIRLLSRVRYPEFMNEDLIVSVDGKEYKYRAITCVVDEFARMLKKKMGYRALNYLKVRSSLIKW